MLNHPHPQIFNENLLPYLDALAGIYADMDRAYDRVAEHYGFKCTGCDDNCCYTHFYHYTFLEYGYILKGYRLLDGHTRDEIRKRALKGVDPCKSTGKQEMPGRTLCPLNFNDRCILYTYRPMICRLHGIPHEFQTAHHKVIRAPGCDAFAGQHGHLKHVRFDRTPFYMEMARLEGELKQAIGIGTKLKMTIAEMIVSF